MRLTSEGSSSEIVRKHIIFNFPYLYKYLGRHDASRSYHGANLDQLDFGEILYRFSQPD
jgi:hypothetical protein